MILMSLFCKLYKEPYKGMINETFKTYMNGIAKMLAGLNADNSRYINETELMSKQARFKELQRKKWLSNTAEGRAERRELLLAHQRKSFKVQKLDLLSAGIKCKITCT